MFSLVTVLIHQRVGHGNVWILLRSRSFSRWSTGDLAALELQTFRKSLNRDGVFLQLKALRQSIETFRLDILGIFHTNDTISKRSIRHHNLGNDLFLTRLSHRLLRDLFNTIFLRCIRILVHRIALSVDFRNPLFDLNINRAGYGYLSGTSLGRGTRDFARLRINLQTRRQTLSSVLRLGTLNDVVRQIIEQWRNLISRVLVILRTQRQLLRHHSGKRVCHLPTIRRLTRRRININHSCCKDRGLLQILRRLEITRRQHTLVITLDDAHCILKLFLRTVLGRGVPTNRIIRVRHQPSSLRGHLRTRTALIVIRVVLRNIKNRLRINQREANIAHVVTRPRATQVLDVLEHVHRERRQLHIATLDTRVDVHVIGVDVAYVPQRRPVERAQAVILVVISDLAPLVLTDNLVRTEVRSLPGVALRPLERKVEGTISLRRRNNRFCNVGTFTVLTLVRINDAFLVLTFLFNCVARVSVLPRLNLTHNFIVEVRRNNLYATSGTVTLIDVVGVLARQRASVFTRLPPNTRTAIDRTVTAVVRELTINGRFAGLTVESSGPILFRLGQPTNVVRLLLQHKTTVGNTRTSRTSRKVPRLLNTIQTLGVTARLHIASHNHRVLRFIRVLAPDTDLKVAITGQIPARCTNRVRHTLR